jgi:hypothetical protein
VNVLITFAEEGAYLDGFTGLPVSSAGNSVKLNMKARSNIWLIADGK